LAESRRNDSLDDVRSAALDRARWLVDLLERQRTEPRWDASAALRGPEEFERIQAIAQAEIDGRLAACSEEEGRAAALCLMLASRFDNTGFWRYDSEIKTVISRVHGWTPDEVAVMLLRVTEFDMGFWSAGSLGVALDAAEQLGADGCRAVAPWLRHAHAKLMNGDAPTHLHGRSLNASARCSRAWTRRTSPRD